MKDKKVWLLVLGLSLISLVFVIASFFAPWWAICTSREAQIDSNSSIRADYGLFQTVTVTLVVENTTETITVPFGNLTNEGNIAPLTLTFNVVFIMNTIGLGLTLVMVAAVFLPVFGKTFYRYCLFAGYIGALLLFISTLYMAFELPVGISKVSTVIPLNSKDEITLNPEDLVFFWGTNQTPEVTGWTWGAGPGWFLAFTASILLAVVSSANSTITRKNVL